MKEVTDTGVLQQLEGGASLKPVQDPATLKALNEPVSVEPKDSPVQGLGAIGGYGLKAVAYVTRDPFKSIDDAIRSFVSGATFGWADEIAAGMNTLLGIGEGKTYEENLTKEMTRDESYRSAMPEQSMAMEVAGGLGMAIPGANVVMNSPKLASVPAAVKMATLGGTGGALAGAGEAGPDQRKEGAIFGGTLGAITGFGIGLGKEATVLAISRFRGGVTSKPVKQAAAKILQALQRDELTPDEAFARLQRLGPEGRLVDVGENTRRLGRAVAGQPGKASTEAVNMLESRQAGQGSRMVESINKALDPSGDFAGAVDDLQALRKINAKPLYDAAYAKPINPTEDLRSLFRRPAMKQAWNKAMKIAQNEGDVLPDNLFETRPDGGQVVNPGAIRDVKTLDYIKRGLDDVVEPHRDPITGKIKTNAGRAVDALRKQYIAILDRLSPDYKAARAAWSGPTQSLSMMEQGRRFIRGDEDVIARQIANMTDDERLFFRMGAARALRDTIYNAPDGADAVKRIFGSELKRSRLRQVFPDEKSFREFKDAMEIESELYKTRDLVSPRAGSQTQLRQADEADLARNVGEGVAELAKGNPGTAASRFLGGLLGKSAEKIPPQQAEAVAKMLFTNDPEVNKQIARALSFQRILDKVNVGAGALSVEGGREAATAMTR